MNVFSFCLYGKNKKYFYGMKENYKLIKKYYPSFLIYVYIGNPFSKELVNMLKELDIKIIYTDADGGVTTIYRYLPVLNENIDLLFVRDTDSEINERDRWCINKFIENRDYSVHTIRDHYWHKSRLMAGTTGFKKSIFPIIKKNFDEQFKKIKTTKNLFYGGDEVFLLNHVYPLVKKKVMVHTNINAFLNEKYFPIEYENNNFNFVGNVMEYDNNGFKRYKFKYNDFPMKTQLVWLEQQKKYNLILEVGKNINIINYPFGERTTILSCLCLGCIFLYKMEEAMKFYEMFKYCEITNNIISNSNCFWQIINYNNHKVIAATDINYKPKDKEIVYYYGQFPIDYRMLPQSNKIYKNVVYFNDIPHSKVLYDPCWKHIDKIYIINLKERKDRYIEVMTELCRMNAPLDRVYHYKAEKDATQKGAYIGATKNHLDVMKDMKDKGYTNCLVLEDDFVFTSDIEKNKKNLNLFFERKYDFDICFLAASRFYKREQFDDLLLCSHQECTTSSSYLLNKKTIEKVYNCVLEGYNLLCKKDSSADIYCIDRYWTKMNKDNKMFIFSDKLGYQRPNYSNIKRTVSMFLD